MAMEVRKVVRRRRKLHRELITLGQCIFRWLSQCTAPGSRRRLRQHHTRSVGGQETAVADSQRHIEWPANIRAISYPRRGAPSPHLCHRIASPAVPEGEHYRETDTPAA